MQNNRLDQLQELLRRASAKGVNVEELLKKIENAKHHSKSKTIKIVLMGAFSDGKTTVIAGVTERIESNMKIDVEESSDELTFYHVPALGYDFEIVDTPGLFGSKEKERDGRNIRYSDITRDYVSQAHIVMYVTDAVNSLKDSHSQILKYTLRDLKKLPSAIFVINKMDEAGYELGDEQDFNRGEKIKKATFINRLDQIIKLTDSEKRSLNVVCVAANPNGKGLDKWFQRKEAYLNRSRMPVLAEVIKRVALSVNKDNLNQNVETATLTDLARQGAFTLKTALDKMNSKIQELITSLEEVKIKASRYRKSALDNKRLLLEALSAKQYQIETDINLAEMDTLASVVNRHIGEDGSRLDNTINQIFSEYAEKNKVEFEKSGIPTSFEKISELEISLVKTASVVLKNTKVTADTVKLLRNTLASSFKFKPWQAVKWGKFATKFLAIGGLIIDAVLWWKQRQQREKFEKAKRDIISLVTQSFKNAEQNIATENQYFQNLAPGVLVAEEEVNAIQQHKASFIEARDSIRTVYEEIMKWCDNSDSHHAAY